jgi:predicted N-acetyltransferase YhbS
MIQIKRVDRDEEIVGIKDLQMRNHKSILSKEEMASQGFVTAEYSIDFLKRMNEAEPSVIAVDSIGKVVGYAIASPKSIQGQHSFLDELFAAADELQIAGNAVQALNYILVGQLCVAKSHRGQGLVTEMYNFFRKDLSPFYDCVITDVDLENPRSLKAHLNAGYQILATKTYGGLSWNVVFQDWR